MNASQGRVFLVTGAAGFVGGEVTRQLLQKGVSVRLLVRHPKKVSEFVKQGAEIVQGDLRDPTAVQQAVKGIYGVYHIAAVYREANLPDQVFYDVNLEGTRILLDASVTAGVHRFIHCSTGGVLGDIQNPPGNEFSPYAPDDVYQESKVAGEKLALDYFRTDKIRGAVIRPAMIYGPHDTRFLKLFRAIAKKRFAHIGPGTQWVHYIDVRDLARAFLLAMERDEHTGSIYTIAGQRPMHFMEFVNIIADTLQVPRPRIHIPLKPLQWLGTACEVICRPFGISPPIYRRRVDFFKKSRYFDISCAQRELHYQPQQSVEQEVRDVCNWYKAQGLLQ